MWSRPAVGKPPCYPSHPPSGLAKYHTTDTLHDMIPPQGSLFTPPMCGSKLWQLCPAAYTITVYVL